MIGTKFKIGDYFYFTVPKGTVIEVPNPKWEESKIETHFDIKACLDEDVVVCTTGQHSNLTILEIKENS